MGAKTAIGPRRRAAHGRSQAIATVERIFGLFAQLDERRLKCLLSEVELCRPNSMVPRTDDDKAGKVGSLCLP